MQSSPGGGLTVTTDRGRILIAGAGPVGLAAALELARMGKPLRIVDARQVPSEQSKAIAINARTLELLEACGATERLLELGRKIPGLNFLRGDQVLFQISVLHNRASLQFYAALPQCRTERTLEQRLKELGVQVERSTELVGFSQDDGSVHRILCRHGIEQAFEASYLIGLSGVERSGRTYMTGIRPVYQFSTLDVGGSSIESDVLDARTWDRQKHVIGVVTDLSQNMKLKLEYTANLEDTGASQVNNAEWLGQLELKF